MTYLSECTKKEWISTPSTGAKSLGIELITTIIETFPEKLKNGDFKSIINEDIKILLQKIFAMNSDQQIIGIKSCRLAVIIMNQLNMLYDLVDDMLKFINTNFMAKSTRLGMPK